MGAERTKAGLGIVVSGREQIVHSGDPWNSLGYQLLDDVCVVFDSGNCAAAATFAAHTRNRISSGPLKAAVTALVHFLEGYAHWDRFDHASAARSFESFAAQRNLLAQLVSLQSVEAFATASTRACRFLGDLTGGAKPSRRFAIDLLANANRRLLESRWDDSVARAYRAIEAIAQWRLAEFHGVASTAKVPLDHVPEPLRTKWSGSADGGLLRLGLQDGYRLLGALGDQVGERFRDSTLPAGAGGQSHSPLVARNASYLAHGFQPARIENAQRLLSEALVLLDASQTDLPEFPRLRGLIGK